MADSDSDDDILFGGITSLADVDDTAAEAEEAAETGAARSCEDVELALLFADGSEEAWPTTVGALRESALLQPYAEHFEAAVPMLLEGRYADVLNGELCQQLFRAAEATAAAADADVLVTVRSRVVDYMAARAAAEDGDEPSLGETSLRAMQVLVVGVAALNLFCQANYTGPELTPEELPVLPLLQPRTVAAAAAAAGAVAGGSGGGGGGSTDGATTEAKAGAEAAEAADPATVAAAAADLEAMLALMAVDGELPYPNSIGAHLLLAARATLSVLADPACPSWTVPVQSSQTQLGNVGGLGDNGSWEPNIVDSRPRLEAPLHVLQAARSLPSAAWWSARANVTHHRLMLASEDPTTTLWSECDTNFRRAIGAMAGAAGSGKQVASVKDGQVSSELWLEWGLARYHYNRADGGKQAFEAARKAIDLEIEMTGIMGKRTK